jgi:hypothetical protein
VSQVWKHPVEIANGVDDDANGYIDDLKGWDFGDGDNDPSSQPVIDPATDIDIGFHGTFVAAIAAAATNNGTGIAGAGWNCRMMPLKVGNAAGDIPLSAVTEAFEYAADQGAEVLNMSLGTQDTTARAYFQALVDMATSANVLCVASAGNDGVSSMSFPAGCDNVLAVGATESNNTRADYSNWGPWVDVAAPGSLMWSAICRNYVVDDWSQIFYIFLWSWDGENPYMYNDGTSFSSPLTAGVCGLVRSKMPSLTPQQVIQHIVNTGDVVAYDHPIGPRLNAFRALNEQVLGVGPIEPVALMFERPSPNPFSTTTTIAFTLAEGGPARLRLYDCSGRMVRELASGNLPPGRHRLTWDGTGMDGRRQRSGVYFAQLESGGRTATKRVALTR